MFLQTSLHRFKIFTKTNFVLDVLSSSSTWLLFSLHACPLQRVLLAFFYWLVYFFTIKVFLLSKTFFSKATTRHCVSKFDKVDALLNLFFALFKSQAPSHHSCINFMTSSMDHENRFTRRLKRRMRRCARSLLLSGFGSFHFASLWVSFTVISSCYLESVKV